MATLIGDLKVIDSALFLFRSLTPSYIDLVSIVIVLATNSCLDLEEETVVYLHVFGVFIVAVEHVCK